MQYAAVCSFQGQRCTCIWGLITEVHVCPIPKSLIWESCIYHFVGIELFERFCCCIDSCLFIRDRSLLTTWGGQQIGRDNTLKKVTPTLHSIFLENRTYCEGLGMGKLWHWQFVMKRAGDQVAAWVAAKILDIVLWNYCAKGAEKIAKYDACTPKINTLKNSDPPIVIP